MFGVALRVFGARRYWDRIEPLLCLLPGCSQIHTPMLWVPRCRPAARGQGAGVEARGWKAARAAACVGQAEGLGRCGL